MAEIVRVKIDQEKDGETKLTSEFSVEGEDTGDAPVNYQWIPIHLEIETRVESTWYRFLPDIIDHSPLTDYDSFRESEEAWVWFEIANMLAEAKTKLLRARGYKEVENSYSNGEIVKIVHLYKMGEFHEALKAIKKLEDLILRLIFEGTGRSFANINTARRQWERDLTLNRITAGVADRANNAVLTAMSDDEYDELVRILDEMEHNFSPEMDAFWTYRHALEHRMPQSVDDRRFYPYWREGLNPDWQFLDLFEATVRVYEHYYRLLERLAQLSISNHPAYRRP
jgi:hypothetical protein